MASSTASTNPALSTVGTTHKSEIYVNTNPSITHLRRDGQKTHIFPYICVVPPNYPKLTQSVPKIHLPEGTDTSHEQSMKHVRHITGAMTITCVSKCRSDSVGDSAKRARSDQSTGARTDRPKFANVGPTVSSSCHGVRRAKFSAAAVYAPKDSHSPRGSINFLDCQPVANFNDGGYWPIAIAVDETQALRQSVVIYVVYSHHIAEFLEDGCYVRCVTSLEEGFYNDIALVSNGRTLAACVSDFLDYKTHIYRIQRIHIYLALSGRKLYTIGGDIPLHSFHAPIMPLCAKDACHIAVYDDNGISEINTVNGHLNKVLRLDGLCCVESIAYSANKYYATDAASGNVNIYDSMCGELLRVIPVVYVNGEQVSALRGLDVDSRENVIVSDCSRGHIWVFDKNGSNICTIRSINERLKLPLNLAVERVSGYVYVVDHGNTCIKKFRYLF